MCQYNPTVMQLQSFLYCFWIKTRYHCSTQLKYKTFKLFMNGLFTDTCNIKPETARRPSTYDKIQVIY